LCTGIVEKITSNEENIDLTVNFMSRAPGRKFCWPLKPDRQIISIGEILCIMQSAPVQCTLCRYVVANYDDIEHLLLDLIDNDDPD